MSQENEQPPKKEEQSPAVTLFFGIACIVIGIGMYYYFGYIEQEGGRIRTHVLIILAYTTLGKQGVLGLFGLLGGFAILLSAWEFAKGKKSA